MANDIEGFEGALENPKEGLESSGGYEGLSDSAKDYLQEINVNSGDWESMSDADRKSVMTDLTERLNELGIDNPESQDKALRDAEISPEILCEFRKAIFDDKMSELEKCGPQNEISKEDFIRECPEGEEVLSLIVEHQGDFEGSMTHDLKFYRLENGDYALIHGSDGDSNTKAVFSDGSVYAKSGGIEGGNKGLNEVLNTGRFASNTTYFVDGRSVYEHDADGRLINESTVYTGEFDEKSKRDSATQRYIKDQKDGIEGDDSSHSVQSYLGGPNESINQTPMRRDINNTKEWKDEENRISSSVEHGKTVYSEHTYSYEGDSRRPSFVTSQTRIDEETSELKEFDNRVVVESVEGGEEKKSLNISERAFSELPRHSLSEAESQYVTEAIESGSESMLILRIDELNGNIDPPKAIDSNKDIDELLGDHKSNIDKIFLEAPSDSIQIELAAEELSDIEGTQFQNWEKLSLEERTEALQNIETKVADIAHRPACPVHVQNLPEGTFGFYNPTTKEIVINERYIMDNNPASHNECLDTILHEGRHAYQDFNMACRQVHASPGDVSNWYMNEYKYGYQDAETYGFKAYAMQPVECDARKFAEDILSKFEKQA